MDIVTDRKFARLLNNERNSHQSIGTAANRCWSMRVLHQHHFLIFVRNADPEVLPTKKVAKNVMPVGIPNVKILSFLPLENSNKISLF